jgi:hypothetical protein
MDSNKDKTTILEMCFGSVSGLVLIHARPFAKAIARGALDGHHILRQILVPKSEPKTIMTYCYIWSKTEKKNKYKLTLL